MKKRTIALLLAAVLLLGVGAGATIAWLTAESATVKNTFTVGDINIKLEEHDTGVSTGTVVTARSDIKIIPGATVAKDPFVTVLSGSEKCYVYAKVVNNLKIGNTTVGTLTLGDGWEAIGVSGDTTLYKYSTVVDAGSADVAVTNVFSAVAIDGEAVTKANISSLKDKTIEITAYAHQSEGTTAAVADDAAIAWAEVTALSD